MSRRAMCLVVLSLGIVACSTTNVTNVYVVQDGAANDGGEDAGVTDSAASDAAGDATVDAGAPDLQSYWPLAVGYGWQFTSVTVGGDAIQVSGTTPFSGRLAFIIDETVSPGLWGQDHLSPDPDHSVEEASGRIGDAATWSLFLPNAASGSWASVASVTVPAGTFSDCIKQGSVPPFFIFCRGVGPVDFAYTVQGSPREYKLSSKSF